MYPGGERLLFSQVSVFLVLNLKKKGNCTKLKLGVRREKPLHINKEELESWNFPF